MCVGITPPCPKCGAPARWKTLKTAGEEALRRINKLATFLDGLDDECPIKEQLKNIIEGRSNA